MQTHPLTGSLGAEITDLQLSQLSDSMFDDLCQTLWQHQVLVLRNQNLSIENHRALGQRFGELHFHPAFPGPEGFEEVLVIKNQGKANTITEVWHSDVSCDARPPSISILRALDVPQYGGDTMWADQYRAWDTLSQAMQNMLRPLRAVHKNFDIESAHPVVRTHPETGRRALYVNAGFTKHFEGMTVEESRPLLQFLVTHASQPDLTMRHRWQSNDVVIWDNRCVMHFAIHDYGDSPREMQRVTVRGEVPA